MKLIDLQRIDSSMTNLVGGKAAALGEMLQAGELVPDGFCLTTAAFDGLSSAADELPDGLRAQIVTAYERLGAGAVAVRSSATAEDLPFASFAGQQDTYLDVVGADAVVKAVQNCWASLWNERAVQYREANGIGHDTARMAVIVQRMVDPEVAGVLFTANPVTGTRTETVVDAAPGLGTAVVDGHGRPDHYVLKDHRMSTTRTGCLDGPQLDELRSTGLRLQNLFDSPQDVEWAIDKNGLLWLLQSRPVTTLFPLPPRTDRPQPRVYVTNGPVQGMLRPFTRMGFSGQKIAFGIILREFGLRADPLDGPAGIVDIGGRMYFDATAALADKGLRGYLGDGWLGGPQGTAVLERVRKDLSISPENGRAARRRFKTRVALQLAPSIAVAAARALLRPAAAPARAQRVLEETERRATAPAHMTAAQRLRFVENVQKAVFHKRTLTDLYWPVAVGLLAARVPVALLGDAATAGEVETVLRGMPNNTTTEMDLELWHLARRARQHRDVLLDTPPAELAARYFAGELPEFGLGAFLARYGRRGAAEIDLGVPRWAEDPAPVFSMIANYLLVTDPEQAPDRRFAKAAADAEAMLGELVERARGRGRVRAGAVGFFLRRARELGGLRELPKFAWLYAIAQMREQILLVGEELADRGLLECCHDVMFLDLREARQAVDGADFRDVIAERRETYDREKRRRYIPRVLLSDGTDPEAAAPAAAPREGLLAGVAGAPGTVTAVARVVLDPADARLEPGEILVAPTTDPGWTPLFLTAGGLVAETGSPMAHGPTVAREYGIPAVVSVTGATQLIRSGQRITVDGATGTVDLAPR
ncbi:phosphoenolpyruvate synthase family protein [Streptomyces sp. NBRC 110611]|nr:phosphoenolpyruvate synthase family protein [Streptomyces sp. NBRC 110611]